MSLYSKLCNFCKARAKIRILLLFSLFPFSTHASPFDCEDTKCGLLSSGTYEHLALGTVLRVATDADAESVYRWARQNGYWSSLPDDLTGFIQNIRLLSVEIPGPAGPESVTLAMGREHFEAINIAPGDFVRYTPHQTQRPVGSFGTAAEAAYWNLYGCIAVLCRAEDTSCPARYAPGIFNRENGIQLGLYSEQPVTGGIRIDTGTYMPLRREDQQEAAQ